MIRVPAAALLLVLVSACSSLPVGLGGTHRMVRGDENGVVFVYDRTRGESLQYYDAVAHCKKFGKSAVPTRNNYGWSWLPEQRYECRASA